MSKDLSAAQTLLNLGKITNTEEIHTHDGSVLWPGGQEVIMDNPTHAMPSMLGGTQQNANFAPPPRSAAPNASVDINQLISTMTALMQQNMTLMNRVSAQQESVKREPTYHYNVLPDLSHNIPMFDGISGASSAKIWLKQLESTATLHCWTEAIAFETARSHLEKAAKNWYLASLDEINDWKSFRHAFSKTFLLEKSLTERFQEMQKREQGPNESVTEIFL